jgi:nucleoside-diphosphate-sugar epimerase
MTFLVTGAAGFVGLNVVECILTAGRSVIGFDCLNIPEQAARRFTTLPGNLHFIKGSIASKQDLEAAFSTLPIEAVIHCAVITAGAERERTDPETIVAVNVQGAVATLTAAARFGARRFVYPSSGAVYGFAARGAAQLDEDTLVPQPATLYAATKHAAEIVLGSVAKSQRIGFVAVRLGTVFGPWEYATGVRDTLSPMLQSLERLKQGKTAILTPAHTVDYIYSRDVAAGLVALADAKVLPRTLYNLGTGRTQTAADWCAAIAALRPDFQWHTACENEVPNVTTHTSFDRPAMNVTHLARDASFQARFELTEAAQDYLAFHAGQ